MNLATFVGSLAVAALTASLASHRAEACAGFFPKSDQPRELSLALEEALIVYDADKRLEHFVREATFRGDGTPFGFVVPTPSRPEVAKVAKSPFASLDRSFPFVAEKSTDGLVAAAAAPEAAGTATSSVTVLEKKKVGSFTAFVLSATDKGGLTKWLDENGLGTTSATEAWLDHYVKRHFFYVAMRYDPPKTPGSKAPSGNLRAETVRISFATPLPYYPYEEPVHSDARAAPRVLSLWFASNEAFVPAALEKKGSERRWVTPLREGHRKDDAAVGLRVAIGELSPLAPAKIVVQTFQDQKTSRTGFGDIVFVPEKLVSLDDKRRAELMPMLALLDDTLEGAR